MNAHIAFLLALIATAGSLFFSEVMHLPPCVLCWYQRICMYPLVYLYGYLLVTGKKEIFKISLGFIIGGLVIAGYHNLLYYGLIAESIIPCAQGISCTSKQIEWFGFVTIPLLSLTSFTLLFLISVKELFFMKEQK